MFNSFFTRSFLAVCLLISSAYSCNHNASASKENAKVKPGKGFEIQGLAVSAPPNRMDSSVFQPMIDINTNSIAVIPYAFCKMPDATVQFKSNKKYWGESDEGVLETVRMAHERNISVMLKPHLWISHGSYTGHIKFEDAVSAKSFEESYTEYILHFAKVAEEAKVHMYCIGTELGGIAASRPLYFSALIDEVRKVYRGKLTYAANWDDYKAFNAWDKLDFIGVDAYFPLSSEKEPSLKTLKTSWKPIMQDLKNLHLKIGKPILFAEFGYRNSDYNTKEPWKEEEKLQNNNNQVVALEALFSSFQNESWFAGGYIWKWFVDKRHLSFNRQIDFTPQGQPALETVKKWFK